MEFCALGSLRDIATVVGHPFKEEQISVICKYVLKGLEYLHGQGKIHRDIKTDNVLVNHKGQPKLADFGISGELNNTLQKRNTLIGTPFFLAPEVIVSNEGSFPCL
ncbi:Serine/threonine-protein kinase 4 [Coelomomyces lativittatus]|nr:Serine/threonine-protein kinase 4 [Coelomomyces lativittatus]